MMEITEDFIKLMQIAVIIVGVGGIFFTFINYKITVLQDSAGREAIVLGNYLLDNECLTYRGTKGLFDSTKLGSVASTCFSFPYGSFTIDTLGNKGSWSFVMGESNAGSTSSLTVSVRMADGSVVPATLKVFV